MNEMQEDIFGVRIDNEGKENLRVIFKMTRLLFWVNILVGLLVLAYAAFPFIKYPDVTRENNPQFYWAIRVYLCYSIPWVVLATSHFYFFQQFSGKASRSLRDGDSAGFNKSFSWMGKSLQVSAALIILNIIFFCYSLFSGF